MSVYARENSTMKIVLAILKFIVKLLGSKKICGFLIDLLKEQAEKTNNKVDDSVVKFIENLYDSGVLAKKAAEIESKVESKTETK
jgi:hypothetical protein